MVDATGSMTVRPGIEAWGDFPAAPDASPVIGMFAWRSYLIYVTEDRKIWAWLGAGNVIALSDATAATQLDGTGRPVFTYDSQRVVIAGGGATQKWEGVGLSARLGGSPPNATHIAYIAQRFIINQNDLSGILDWTPPGVGNHEIWDTSLNFAEAEAAPDPLLAVFCNVREAYAFGTQTVQVFVPDPATAFSVASVAPIGLGARYSVIDTDGQFAFLDNKVRLVQSDGRTFDVLSSPGMDADLQQMGKTTDLTDCWGCRIKIGSFDVLMWVFPTAGRATYYERTGKRWGEWFSSLSNGSQVPWIAQSYYYWDDQKLHLIGLKDGTIGLLTFDVGSEIGQPIRAVSRSGFDSKGTLVRKTCTRLQVQKRGPGSSVELRYRDDLGAFKTAIQFTAGATDNRPTTDRYGLGMYRERQYEITATGTASVDFALTRVTETYELADS